MKKVYETPSLEKTLFIPSDTILVDYNGSEPDNGFNWDYVDESNNDSGEWYEW
jgi:hypothetical protein